MSSFKNQHFVALIFALIIIIMIYVLSLPEKNIKKPKKIFNSTINSSENNNNLSGDSYWFIVYRSKDGTKEINGFVCQKHLYFSYIEFKNECNDGFLLNLQKISKNTFYYNNK